MPGEFTPIFMVGDEVFYQRVLPTRPSPPKKAEYLCHQCKLMAEHYEFATPDGELRCPRCDSYDVVPRPST
jgi:hypothetical protein